MSYYAPLRRAPGKPRPWALQVSRVAPEWQDFMRDCRGWGVPNWKQAPGGMDLISGARATTTSDQESIVRRHGLGRGIQFVNGSNAGIWWDQDPRFDTSRPWTLLWYGAPTAVNNVDLFFNLSGAGEYVGLGTTTANWKIVSNLETPGDAGVAVPVDGIPLLAAVEWDGSQLRMFINGEPYYAVTPSGSDWQNTTTFGIGECATGANGGGLEAVGSYNGYVALFQRRFGQGDWARLLSDPWAPIRPTSTVTIPAASGGGGVTLTVADMAVATSTEQPALTQAHTLAVDEIAAATSMEAPALVQAHTLSVADLLAGTSLDEPSLTQGYVLSVDELLAATSLEEPALTQAHVLAVQEFLAATSLEEPTLNVGDVLEVAGLSVATSLESPALTQAYVLAVADMLVAASLEGVQLTQAHVLAVQDLLSAVTMDEPTLSLATVLAVADLLSGTSLDQPSLTQSHVLAPDALDVGTSLEEPALTQAGTLTVEDMAVATLLDAVSLAVAGEITDVAARNFLAALNRPRYLSDLNRPRYLSDLNRPRYLGD